MRKSIKDFEGLYSITSQGVVYCEPKKWIRGFMGERALKLQINKHGYHQVILQSNKVKKTRLVHRLVAEAFIRNPSNYPQVNHINGIKTDNRVENLEWCTSSQNIKHAHDTKLKIQTRGKNPNRKQVVDIKNGNIYECIQDAVDTTGFSYGYVHNMLNNKHKNTTSLRYLKSTNPNTN